jgi:hypothetical protein
LFFHTGIIMINRRDFRNREINCTIGIMCGTYFIHGINDSYCLR